MCEADTQVASDVIEIQLSGELDSGGTYGTVIGYWQGDSCDAILFCPYARKAREEEEAAKLEKQRRDAETERFWKRLEGPSAGDSVPHEVNIGGKIYYYSGRI